MAVGQAAPVEHEHQFKELDKFMLFTPAPGVENQRSNLTWSTFRGNPRITVWTRVPDDTGKGMLAAPMNPTTFLTLMSLLEEIAKGEPGRNSHIENWTTVKGADGKPSPEKTLLSTTWVGKDKEGMVWISVRAENRPTIAFKFEMSNFHKVYRGNEQLRREEGSVLEALSFAYGVRKVITPLMGELRPPYDPNKAKGKPGGGQQGNYPKKTTNMNFDDLAEDIAF